MQREDSKVLNAVELISEQGFSGLGEALQILINEAMKLERNRYLNAKPYERTEQRQDYANGYKPKRLKTRLGELNLSIPQVREGSFYPSFLSRGLRSEQALKIALSEMYIHGVSTRKVNKILEELCGFEVSSTEVSRASKLLDEELNAWRNRKLENNVYLYLDARYEKVREGGCVVDCAVLLAYGINSHGKREIIGVSVSLSEHEVHWRNFLQSLVERGLHGVKLITSDAHSGLKAALKGVFPSVPWQRCQFHLQQNAQAYVPRINQRREVAQSIRAIFNAENKVEADRLLKQSVARYAKDMPKLSSWMEESIPEGLTIFAFPQTQHRRLRTVNNLERVNKEIRRRTRVASIFPNIASCERLVTAIVMEISEEWQTGMTYLNIE